MPGESQQAPGSEPDPTVLTTEQLLREVENVKDWTKEKVENVTNVTAERFNSVETQFSMSERQRVEQKQDTKAAVDAALAAAKEAVQEQTKASAEAIGKSEGQTATQITALGTQFAVGIKAVSDKYDDLKENQVRTNDDFKERLTRIETAKLTENNNHDQNRMDYGLLVSIASVFIAIIAVVVVVLLANPR